MRQFFLLFLLAAAQAAAQSPFMFSLTPNYVEIGKSRAIDITGFDLKGNSGVPEVCYRATGTLTGCEVPLVNVQVISSNHLKAEFPAQASASSGAIFVRPTFNGSPIMSINSLSFYVQTADTIPAPVLNSLSRIRVVAGSGDTPVGMNGSGFAPPLDVGTSPLLIAPGNSPETVSVDGITNTFIPAIFQASKLTSPKSAFLTVQVGSRLTEMLPFSIVAPSITSVSPSSATQFQGPLQLILQGEFARPGTGATASTVLYTPPGLSTPTALATVGVADTETELRREIPSAGLTQSGTATIRICSSPGGTQVCSNTINFQIDPPLAPIDITSISPNTATVGSPSLQLTVNGSGFETVSVARFNGVDLTTVFVSASQLTATIPAALLTTAGNFAVTVRDNRGRTSNSVNFQVVPALQLSAISPQAVNAGVGPFQLQVTGQGFASGAEVRINGTAVSTVLVSGTSLTATIPASLVATPGQYPVTVRLASGAISNALPLTVLPRLQITRLAPQAASGQRKSVTLRVFGQGFVRESVIRFDGVAAATTYVNAEQITATVPEGVLAAPGMKAITVANPLGAISNPAQFEVR